MMRLGWGSETGSARGCLNDLGWHSAMGICWGWEMGLRRDYALDSGMVKRWWERGWGIGCATRRGWVSPKGSWMGCAMGSRRGRGWWATGSGRGSVMVWR